MSQVEFFDKASEIERILESKKLRKINKFFRIDNISSISKFFFYLAIPGVFLVILSIFISTIWIFCWIYALVVFILMGFVFTKSNQKFNFLIPLVILAIIVFVLSSFGQSALQILSQYQIDPINTDEQTIIEGGADTDQDIKVDYDHIDALRYILEPLESYLEEGYTLDNVIYAMLQGVPIKEFTYKTTFTEGDYAFFFKSSAWDDPPGHEPRFKDELREALEEAYDYIQEHDIPIDSTADIKGFLDALENITENPIEDLPRFVESFIDLINWIVFVFIIGYGATGIADFFTFQWEKIAKKVAFIAMAIAIMTLIYSMFQLIETEEGEVHVKTIWDTVGGAWDDMLHKVGLTQLDQSGNDIANTKTVIEGFMSYIPLITTISLFSLAFAFRHSDFKSILFSRDVIKDNRISVERSKFSIPILVILFVMAFYVIGYFLITADPTITINPYITLAFYLFSIVVLFLIGGKVLILNKEFTLKSFTIDVIKWTILGLLFLYLWFQVFQPVMYDLNLIDTPTGHLTMSQESVFTSNLLEQFFLVAAPETLIFQIFPIGLGNRIYFWFRRTRIWEKEEKRLKLKQFKIWNQYINIKINSNSASRENIRRIALASVLKQKHDTLTETLERNKIQHVPHRFFILPTIIAGLIGSFFFSWYHSFRRGIDFITWWQNPMLGMVYFGAGFFLCFIAYFNFAAAIFVHAFNNIIALILSEG